MQPSSSCSSRQCPDSCNWRCTTAPHTLPMLSTLQRHLYPADWRLQHRQSNHLSTAKQYRQEKLQTTFLLLKDPVSALVQSLLTKSFRLENIYKIIESNHFPSTPKNNHWTVSPCATSTRPFQGRGLHHCPGQPVPMPMFQRHSFPAAHSSLLLLFAVHAVCLNFSRLLRKLKDGVICICFIWAITGCCLHRACSFTNIVSSSFWLYCCWNDWTN